MISPRSAIGLCVVAAIMALAPPAIAQNALGANFNEHYEDVDWRELDLAKSQWLRIFLPMPQIDRAGAAQTGAVQKLLEASGRGNKTILSLKWPFPNRDFPKPGSTEFAKELARLDALLPIVMGKMDILVIGNEPYIESRPEDRDIDLNVFYEAMAKHVIAYRASNCGPNCKTQLYMGALNRLDLKRNLTKSTDRWMEYVRVTPEIEGVDIHPHIPSIEASKPFLDYILPRMRNDQKFLVTEFSLVWWWQQNLNAPVAPAFAEKYKLPATAKNWQIIAVALKKPTYREQWDDFLAMSPWFKSREHYLVNQMKLFRDTGRLAVATYGFKQASSMSENFGPDKTPWLLNSVFAARTIARNADGTAQPQAQWLSDFQKLQDVKGSGQ